MRELANPKSFPSAVYLRTSAMSTSCHIHLCLLWLDTASLRSDELKPTAEVRLIDYPLVYTSYRRLPTQPNTAFDRYESQIPLDASNTLNQERPRTITPELPSSEPVLRLVSVRPLLIPLRLAVAFFTFRTFIPK